MLGSLTSKVLLGTQPVLPLQLTYYEFAKEELETLDNGNATTGSSITTSSSDELDTGQQLDRQTPKGSADMDAEQEHALQRDDEGLEPVHQNFFACFDQCNHLTRFLP